MTRPLTVLAVDDHTDTLENLCGLLRATGHRAAPAADGPSALRAAKEIGPDVVLLDILMPGMDGYEVGRELKRMRPERPPLVVAVSGSPADPARAGEAGIDLCIAKPVDPPGLLALLGRFGKVLETGEEVPSWPLTVPSKHRQE